MINPDTVLFFDMDGTLIDTNRANFLSYEKALNLVLKTTNNLTYNATNRLNRSYLKKAFPLCTDTEFEKIVREKEKCYEEFLHETTLNSTIADIVLKYFKTNKTILVTNCRSDRALITLNYHNLTDKFTNILCREHCDADKKINKFKNAISVLKVRTNNVVAFENEESEIADAKQAGILIINTKITLNSQH